MTESQSPETGQKETSEKVPRMTAGQEFSKKITPLGCIFVLIVFVLFLSYCFRSGRDPLPGYTPPRSMDYYAQNDETLTALQSELEANVFPALGGVETCEIEAGKLRITIDRDHYNDTRAGILHHFSKDLFTFAVGS